MRLQVGGARLVGEAFDVPGADPDRLLAAVRSPDDPLVACRSPGPLHRHVGHVHPERSLRVSAAVAAAARSLGARAPQDAEVAAVEAELRGIESAAPDLADARRRLAAAGADRDALRERVARLGGRLSALREADADPEAIAAVESDLDEANRRLAEAETERVAAEQTLARVRAAARATRDERERRLELEDRAGNLRRAARRHLVEAHYERFAAATAAVPGDADPGTAPDEYRGPSTTAALALVRMGRVRAPVVLDVDCFPSASAARARLDAPVIRV